MYYYLLLFIIIYYNKVLYKKNINFFYYIMTDTHIQQEIDNIIETGMISINQLEITNSDTTTEPPEIDNASVETFNTALQQYMRINEEITTLMQAIKKRNEIKRNLGESLSNFLRTNQIKNVNLDGSYKGKRLEATVSNVSTGFNRTTVTETLVNELKEDQELFDKIMQALSRTSVMKEVWKLKIVEEKQSRKKKQSNILDEASNLLQQS